MQLSYCAGLDSLQKVKTKLYSTNLESKQTNINDQSQLGPNYTNVLFRAGSSGSYMLQLKQYMSMHKLKYPAGDGVLCSLGDSCLVHGLTVGQWDTLRAHRVNPVPLV